MTFKIQDIWQTHLSDGILLSFHAQRDNFESLFFFKWNLKIAKEALCGRNAIVVSAFELSVKQIDLYRTHQE